MSDFQSNNIAEEHNSTWQPGAKLKSIREEANIALDVIAKESLIPFSKLQSLEEDDYLKVGKEVFVIAYMRKYAKSLGISSDPFVEQFKFITGFKSTADAMADAPTIAESTKNATLSAFSKIKGWQLVAIVVLAWLLSVLLLDGEVPELEESVQGASEQSIEPLAAHVPAELSKPEDETVVAADEPAAMPQVEEGKLSTESESPLSASQGEVSEGDILVMSFADRCWVQVWDAKGEVIFAHEQNSGDNLRLSGEAPFSVMLGNAAAVDLLVNGRRLSTEPAEGKRTRRLNNIGP